MNKEALLQGVYDSAFNDELEKIAEEDKVKDSLLNYVAPTAVSVPAGYAALNKTDMKIFKRKLRARSPEDLRFWHDFRKKSYDKYHVPRVEAAKARYKKGYAEAKTKSRRRMYRSMLKSELSGAKAMARGSSVNYKLTDNRIAKVKALHKKLSRKGKILDYASLGLMAAGPAYSVGRGIYKAIKSKDKVENE